MPRPPPNPCISRRWYRGVRAKMRIALSKHRLRLCYRSDGFDGSTEPDVTARLIAYTRSVLFITMDPGSPHLPLIQCVVEFGVHYCAAENMVLSVERLRWELYIRWRFVVHTNFIGTYRGFFLLSVPTLQFFHATNEARAKKNNGKTGAGCCLRGEWNHTQGDGFFEVVMGGEAGSPLCWLLAVTRRCILHVCCDSTVCTTSALVETPTSMAWGDTCPRGGYSLHRGSKSYALLSVTVLAFVAHASLEVKPTLFPLLYAPGMRQSRSTRVSFGTLAVQRWACARLTGASSLTAGPLHQPQLCDSPAVQTWVAPHPRGLPVSAT